jgi:hypothetical protein
MRGALVGIGPAAALSSAAKAALSAKAGAEA